MINNALVVVTRKLSVNRSGIFTPCSRRQRLEEIQTGDGLELPKQLKAQINRELDRLELLLKQIAAMESERNSLLSKYEQANCP